MKTILSTKPDWCVTIPDRDGWIDPNTNEMIVSVPRLAERIIEELNNILDQLEILKANGVTE